MITAIGVVSHGNMAGGSRGEMWTLTGEWAGMEERKEDSTLRKGTGIGIWTIGLVLKTL